MKKLFVMMPMSQEFQIVHSVICEAAKEAEQQLGEEIQISCSDKLSSSISIVEHVLSDISQADILIADLSLVHPNVMYELGFAHGREKPVILISQESSSSDRLFDFGSFFTLIYDSSRLGKSFKKKLSTQILDVARHPERFTHPFTGQRQNNVRRPTVFISYSHADSECLQRLQVHLRPLERENQIELWDDTRIKAGTRWREEIEQALDRAAIAVLLISADFLASDFVVDNELPPLLQAAEQRGRTILPVVLKHCRFIRDRNLSVFQAINDPRHPVLSMTAGEQEELWSRIAERIENELNTNR